MLGTLAILGVASLIGVPFGMLTAIYLAEYGRGNFARMVSFLIDLIAVFALSSQPPSRKRCNDRLNSPRVRQRRLS